MSQNNNTNTNEGQASQLRPNRPNDISGPSSALSSFLREQNIYVENRSRRVRREAQETATRVVDLNAMEGVEATAAQSLLYTPSTRSRANSKKKKRESDDEGDNDDAFAPSSSRKVMRSRVRILFCDVCNGRFARKINDEEQTTCDGCLNGTTKEIKKKAVTRKRQINAIKKDRVAKDTVPSLQDLCIAVVVDYIEDVDSLGVISEDSLEKIAKIISRNRKLNDTTSRLFMEPIRRKLELFDCTEMSQVSLLNIAQFCPRLQDLDLDYCGHMTSDVVKAYADKLHHLRSLYLSGAFLVTKETWNYFFKTVGSRLEGFGLRYTARLLKENIDCLVEHCPNITTLKFGHLTAMDSDWLAPIGNLKKLHTFEFAWSGRYKQLKTGDVVTLLSKIGPQLIDLSIKGGHELTDKFITEGVLKHCIKLKKLCLEQCDEITSDAMVRLFTEWDNKGLTHLDIGRCILLDDKVLQAIIRHSAPHLKHLSLHSLEKLTSAGLEALGGGEIVDANSTSEQVPETLPTCTELTFLDCGFVRSMDDFVLKKVIAYCTSLEQIQVWGCHLLTDTIKNTNKLTINGREKVTQGA